MDKPDKNITEACSELEEIIASNKKQLDAVQEQIEAHDPGPSIPRIQFGKASMAIALETMKQNLATLQGGLKPSDCQHTLLPNSVQILTNLARMWQIRCNAELLELLVDEKMKQTQIQEEINKKNICLKENKKLLDVLLKEKKNLENRQEELESQKIVDLEEKLVKVKRLYGEMKLHLKNTVEMYFPEPKVPGYTGMYSLLNELTQRILNRERDAYIEVRNTIWPYYLETLEKHGIIERHPTDHHKIRIIDFSDGRLGS